VRPDTEAQDQALQIVTFGLQRAAGPYRWARNRKRGLTLVSVAKIQHERNALTIAIANQLLAAGSDYTVSGKSQLAGLELHGN
jgi:hypothetical protein